MGNGGNGMEWNLIELEDWMNYRIIFQGMILLFVIELNLLDCNPFLS